MSPGWRRTGGVRLTAGVADVIRRVPRLDDRVDPVAGLEECGVVDVKPVRLGGGDGLAGRRFQLRDLRLDPARRNTAKDRLVAEHVSTDERRLLAGRHLFPGKLGLIKIKETSQDKLEAFLPSDSWNLPQDTVHGIRGDVFPPLGPQLPEIGSHLRFRRLHNARFIGAGGTVGNPVRVVQQGIDQPGRNGSAFQQCKGWANRLAARAHAWQTSWTCLADPLKDSLENMGAQMVREVASKTSDVAGDGTTTATVLAQAIFREGVKTVAAGANPMALKRGIDKAVERATEEIKKTGKASQGRHDCPGRHGVGEWRSTIGNIIAEAMKKVGKDGVITVEESKTMETSLEVVEGMQFDRGYLSPYFVTDPERMEAVLENPLDPDPRKEDQLDERSAAACSSRLPSWANRC